MGKSLKFKSLTSLFSQVMQFSSGLIVTPFVISRLGEEYFSLWVLFLTWVSFEGLFLMGTSQALNRYVPFFIGKNDDSSLASLIRSHLIFYCCLYLLLLVFIFGLKEQLFHFFELPKELWRDYIASLPWLVTGLGVSIINKVFIAVNNGQEKYVFFNSLLSFSIILRLLVTIFFINRGFIVLPQAYLLGQLVIFFGCFLSFLTGPISILNGFSLKEDSKVFKIAMLFGLGSVLMYISDILRHQLDTIIILKLVDLNSLAHYKIGMTLITSVNGLSAGLFGVLLTRLSFHQGSNEKKLFTDLSLKSFFYSSLLGTYFILGISLLASSFLSLWIGDYDPRSLEIIYIMLIPQLLMLTQYPSINMMYSIGKHKALGTLTIVESLLNCGLSIYLVSQLGMIGVAIGTAVGFIISKGIVMPFLLQRFCSLDIKRQLLQILPHYMVGLLCFFVLYRLPLFPLMATPLLDFVVKCTIITVVFFGVLKLFYMKYPKQEAEILSLSGIKRIFR